MWYYKFMKITIESPVSAYLEDYTQDDIRVLKEQLSYKNGKIEQLLKRHMNNRWWRQKNTVTWEERKRELMSELNGSLLEKDAKGYKIKPGFIPYINRLKFTVSNKVKQPALKPLPWIREPEFTPYPYQSKSVKKLLDIGHGNIEIATGMGKSYILLMLAQQIGKDIVVVTPSKSIFMELMEEFQTRLGKSKVGGYGNGKKDIKKPITIAIGKSITMLKEGTKEYEFFANKKALLVDECFPYNTRIHTDRGNIKIGDLCTKYKGTLPKALSFNEHTKTFEYKEILNTWDRPPKNLIKVRCGLISFKCTEDHKILTSNGWKKAGGLNEGDLIVSKYGNSKSNFTCLVPKTIDSDTEDLIIGSFLGDGSVSCSKNGYTRLKINHGIKQRKYALWKYRLFSKAKGTYWYLKENGYSKKPAIQTTTKCFHLDYKLPTNKKYCPQIVVDKLNLRSLAIWFMDDGSLSIQKNKIYGARLHTESFNEDSVDSLIRRIKEIGFNCEKKYNKGFFIAFNTKNARKMIDKICPYFHKSMSYKSNNNPKVGTGIWKCDFEDFSYSKVTELEKIENNDKLYDIEVKDNHNFIVGRRKSGIVAHNCHTWGADKLEEVCHGVLANAPRRLFVSATNTRNDGTIKLLQSITGKNVLNKGIREGIEEGFLCPLKFNIIKTHSPSTKYTKEALETKREHFLYNDKIAEYAAKIANAKWRVDQESTLILVEELVQINKLAKLLQVPFTYIHSASKKEAAKNGLEKVDLKTELERFNNGEVKVLIGTKSISTGTNIYPTHNVINWVGGSSEITTKQGTMGRSTRWMKKKYEKKHKEKTHSQIWDFDVSGQPILQRMLKTRIKYYEETGEKVRFVG